MPQFAVVNRSSLVSGADVAMMSNAVELQILDDAGDAWGYGNVKYYVDESQISEGHWIITILDDPDQADALGYHLEAAGKVKGFVFARPVLEAGGGILDGKGTPYSVSSVLSHEILEMLADPFVNAWWGRTDGTLIAAEICDPVEGDTYTKTILGHPVLVSNFVFPKYTDPETSLSDRSFSDRLDMMGKLSTPLSCGVGGYLIVQRGGEQSEEYGELMPGWRKTSARQRAAVRWFRGVQAMTRRSGKVEA